MTKLPEYPVICEGIVIEMLGHVARDSQMKQFSPTKVRLVKEMQSYLLHHFKEKVSISALASELNRTPNYLTNTYKEITGFTPISYVHHLRIQTAIQLLQTSPITIREVSDLLGYSDQSHFNKMFKKLMGYPLPLLITINLSGIRKVYACNEKRTIYEITSFSMFLH